MNTRPWWKIVNWRIVLAVGVPFWLLVGAGVYLATPNPATPERLPHRTSLPPLGVQSHPFERQPYSPLTVEVAPSPRPVIEVVAAPREVKAGASVFAMVKLLADTIKGSQSPRAAPALAVEAKPEVIAVPEGCKLHGTTLHFVKSPVEAFKLAPMQDKLVFILHLAGNIEDDGFT